jgi:hypothetical protein
LLLTNMTGAEQQTPFMIALDVVPLGFGQESSETTSARTTVTHQVASNGLPHQLAHVNNRTTEYC